jgi:hypothetical protein
VTTRVLTHADVPNARGAMSQVCCDRAPPPG